MVPSVTDSPISGMRIWTVVPASMESGTTLALRFVEDGDHLYAADEVGGRGTAGGPAARRDGCRRARAPGLRSHRGRGTGAARRGRPAAAADRAAGRTGRDL